MGRKNGRKGGGGCMGDGQVAAEELKERAKAGVKWVYCEALAQDPSGSLFS